MDNTSENQDPIPTDAADFADGALKRVMKVLTRLRNLAGFFLTIASVLLYIPVVLCFMAKWDIATGITVFPFWLWALAGGVMAFAAWSFVNRRAPLIMMLLWGLTTIFVADETRPLLRLSGQLEDTHPGQVDGRQILRVITLNCSKRNTDALEEVKRFNPDVVLFQEAPANYYAQELAKSLYGDKGQAISNYYCGVVARGELKLVAGSGEPPYQQVVLTCPNGTEVDVFSIHLEHAVTEWDLWNPDTLRSYRNNRVARRNQLNLILSQYWKTGSTRPALIGGDFNAPASDAIFDLLRPKFEDSFKAAGKGLGNTFHNRLPAIRIDQIWARNGLTPLNGRVVATKNSDHRMLVCDFLLP